MNFGYSCHHYYTQLDEKAIEFLQNHNVSYFQEATSKKFIS